MLKYCLWIKWKIQNYLSCLYFNKFKEDEENKTEQIEDTLLRLVSNFKIRLLKGAKEGKEDNLISILS